MKSENTAKEHYRRLRVLSCERLWEEEVATFDRRSQRERMEHVAVVRAVGVVFSETGTAEQKALARAWLRELLRDPLEKVRRYAMTALPKLGADAGEESELLDLLEKTTSDREKKYLGRTLEKIGGDATLEKTNEGRTAQKAQANVARSRNPGAIRMDRVLPDVGELRIHLRCRDGLERILEDELHERSGTDAKFRLIESGPGMVAVAPLGALRLADIYALRCFSSAGIVLGAVESREDDGMESLARVIASRDSLRVLEAFTDGPIRYRLEFVEQGHRRGAVRTLTNRVYELCPTLLNDSRAAPWQIEIRHETRQASVELTPRLRPDPRFAYRRQDVPAASHPPLAAALARLAGKMEDEIVWDPFCGSGLELIECTLRGGVRRIIGTDRSEAAIEISRANLAAAMTELPAVVFACGDFREQAALVEDGVSLIISNPPMGRRVPIPNLRGLIEDLFAVAEKALRPGGRLVFANPLPVRPAGDSLELEFRQKVDLGGFNVHVEKYVKQARVTARGPSIEAHQQRLRR